jgi:hypothetical protein
MAITPKKPIPLPKSEQKQVQDLEKLLRRGVPALISPAGERIELPGTVVEVLRTAVEFMSHGQTVTLIPDNQAITTNGLPTFSECRVHSSSSSLKAV